MAGISDHPALDQMRAMWAAGDRATAIVAWLQSNGQPPVNPRSLARYGQRYWSPKAASSPQRGTQAALTGPGRTHLIIPDTQVKPGVPTVHLQWIGEYIVDRRPDVIVHLGDHWDMPSLSIYDRGKLQMEGRRYAEDVEAGNEAMALLSKPIDAIPDYAPEKVLLRGNHEDRIRRAIESDAKLEGTISLDDLESPGWKVYDYQVPVDIDSIIYSHMFYNPMTGKPLGGLVSTRLKTLGHSFTQGHQQTLDYALRYVLGRSQHGLVAGACYIHTENYLGPQGNDHWRGVIVKHEVRNGSYDLMTVSLDYLCRKYEGVGLEEFKSKYKM